MIRLRDLFAELSDIFDNHGFIHPLVQTLYQYTNNIFFEVEYDVNIANILTSPQPPNLNLSKVGEGKLCKLLFKRVSLSAKISVLIFHIKMHRNG